MNQSVESILETLPEPNKTSAQQFWSELQSYIPDAQGATKSHQAWPGGYKDHIQECMNLAGILHERLTTERKLSFSVSSAQLVLFLHDCEKPFRHASDEQLSHFLWITKRPTKSDKAFQKQLIEHYGFTISGDEWNALKYVEGEPDSEYKEGTRLQGPLAAFCHVCDTISARIWHDEPKRRETMRPITFQSHNDTIAGSLFVATKPQKLAFLLIQGWTGHQNVQAAKALADLGFTSMTYDMRGNGDSGGDLAKLSRADFVEDSIKAYDFLKQQISEDTAIGVVGSSFGAYTSMLLSEQRPVACLSFRVPASYRDEGFADPQLPQASSDTLTAWRKQPHDYTENKALAALHKFIGPVQIIEAEHDEVIPHQSTMNYANAITDQTKLTHDVMQGAPHNLANEKLSAEYTSLLTRWVKQFIEKES